MDILAIILAPSALCLLLACLVAWRRRHISAMDC